MLGLLQLLGRIRYLLLQETCDKEFECRELSLGESVKKEVGDLAETIGQD